VSCEYHPLTFETPIVQVFRYVERLILHVAKQELEMDEVYVCRFGSVPLKTYLPHGDLDLTAFAPNDKWLQRLKEKLEHEGQSESAANVVSGVHSVVERAEGREGE
jgi:hypothetical protein